MRMKVLVGSTLLMMAAAAVAQTPPPEAPKPAPPQFKFEMHGFVGGSSYVQDGNLGPSEGMNSLYANLPQPSRDRLVYGADVRQSRFNFAVTGPQVFGTATPKGVLEIDFFGGFGAGAFGDVSLTPRLRLAYAELALNKNNRIQFGQNLDLIFAMAPTSLAHIAFPFGYESGNIGWRRPGIFGFHGVEIGGPGSKVEFAWEVGRSQWQDAGGIGNQTVTPSTTAGGTGDRFGFSLGEASGLPAVEARLMLTMGTASFFTTGHWQKVDRTGVGIPDVATVKDLDVIAGNVGGKVVAGPITLAATGYIGKNLAPLLGSVLQFQGITAGNIREKGGWVQAGLNLTKEFSVWGYLGQAKPDEADMRAALPAVGTRLRNTTIASLVQYRSGGYAIGAEYVRFITKYIVAPTNPNAFGAGSQYILTGLYFF